VPMPLARAGGGTGRRRRSLIGEEALGAAAARPWGGAPSVVLTPFFGTCQFVEQPMENGPALGRRKRMRAYWAFGPGRASQPIELIKEPTR